MFYNNRITTIRYNCYCYLYVKIKSITIMLKDFIDITNYIESKGFEIDKIFVKGGYIGKFRLNKGSWKIGKKIYKTQLECQKYTVEAIFNYIKKK